MIKSIEIANFKSHKQTKLCLNNLTIICGPNGVGKSSAIQVLLLIREAWIKDKSFEILDLKSNPVKIGTFNDALYEYGETDAIHFILTFDNQQVLDLVYEANSEDDKAKSFVKLCYEKTKNKFDISQLDQLRSFTEEKGLFSENFQYISAARLGPQEHYPKDDKIVDVYKQLSVVEGKAEFFVHFLEKNKNEDVLEGLAIMNSEFKFLDLMTQVSAWHKYVFEGTNLKIQDIGKLGYSLMFSFDNEDSHLKRTADFEAKNVGFGFSYTLPILVAILSSKKGSLIIIENPEAHLHPQGVSRLTELICLAAQNGIQIIIETHSDHVINSVLVQTKKFGQKNRNGIDYELVSMYQFDRKALKYETNFEEVKIISPGIINYPPSGFFDQINKDKSFLLGL